LTDHARRALVSITIAVLAVGGMVAAGRGDVAFKIASFGIMVGVLVVVHELGHFLVAKAFGIGAPTFSLGIGPAVFRLFRWRGTDFVISALPVGGYVKLAGADAFGDEDADNQVDPSLDFMRRPVWQRLLVMLAGPGMNLLLPFVLFTAVLMFGEPQPDNSVGTVLPGSPAAALGLRPLDRIVAAASEPVDTWTDLVTVLDDHVGEPVTLTIARGDREFEVVAPGDAVRMTKEGFVDTEHFGVWQSRRSSRIGVSDPTSPAARAGLVTGDGIVEVDGAAIRTFEELLAALSPDQPHQVVRVRALEGSVDRATITLTPDPSWQPDRVEPDPNPWGLLHATLFVGEVLADSAAGVAGVRAADRFLSIDGTGVDCWADVLTLVKRTTSEAKAEAEVRSLELHVVREGQELALTFTPRVEREIVAGIVGFRPVMGVRQFGETYVDGPDISKYYSLPQAFGRASEESFAVFERTLTVLGGLVFGDIRISEGLGGPVEIFRVAGKSAEAGPFTYVRVMGMISISLGIFNLLPVPALDGGHIAVYAVEVVRGRPLSLRIRERIQMAGILALVALVLTVTVMDFHRLLGS
jgi:regulator of sigma E protease